MDANLTGTKSKNNNSIYKLIISSDIYFLSFSSSFIFIIDTIYDGHYNISRLLFSIYAQNKHEYCYCLYGKQYSDQFAFKIVESIIFGYK